MNILQNILYGVDTSVLILFAVIIIVTIVIQLRKNSIDIELATKKFKECRMPIFAEITDIKIDSRRQRNAKVGDFFAHKVFFYTITVKYEVFGNTFENTCRFSNPSKLNVGDMVKIMVNPDDPNDINAKNLDISNEEEIKKKYTKETLIWCAEFVLFFVLIVICVVCILLLER